MAQAQAETGATLKALTVLDRRADPYRLDTPVNHRDARWLARWIDELVPSGQVHLRGLHYLLAMIHRPRKPNGKRYANTTADWEWMSETAAKAARWLGYVEFDRIKDQRNATPTIIEAAEPQQPQPVVYTGIAAEIPEIGDLRPSPIMYRDDPQQPYRIAIVGEKSSLAEIVTPEAERLGADVFLPTGDISTRSSTSSPAPPPRMAGRWSCSTSPTATRLAGTWASSSRASCKRWPTCTSPASPSRCAASRLRPTRCASMACRRHR